MVLLKWLTYAYRKNMNYKYYERPMSISCKLYHAIINKLK